MADEEEPEVEEPEQTPAEDEDDHLFGIDLGRRGDRAEQTSRDEVEPPPEKKVRAVIRTLTERLASAAADRSKARPPKEDDPEDDED